MSVIIDTFFDIVFKHNTTFAIFNRALQTARQVVIAQAAIERRRRDAENVRRFAAMPVCLFEDVENLLAFEVAQLRRSRRGVADAVCICLNL